MLKDNLQQWLGVEVWKIPEWYTRAEIAAGCGCYKSPSLLKELQTLVEQGSLVSKLDFDEKKRPVIKYKIAENYRQMTLEQAKRYGK